MTEAGKVHKYQSLVLIAISAALVSGVHVIHETAFALAVFFNIAGWIVTPVIFTASKESISATGSPLTKWACRGLYWLSLAYTGHAYLLASSIAAGFVHSSLIRLRKNQIKMEASK